jgi:hypothetical protein
VDSKNKVRVERSTARHLLNKVSARKEEMRGKGDGHSPSHHRYLIWQVSMRFVRLGKIDALPHAMHRATTNPMSLARAGDKERASADSGEGESDTGSVVGRSKRTGPNVRVRY